MNVQALDGVRILDLTGGIAGPLGVLQLAEHGADVIKIEPPGGSAAATRARLDRAQPQPPVGHARPAPSTRAREVFRELCATADVVVEAFAPGTMAEWGLDFESLHEEFPRLVYCSVPAWPSGSRFEDVPGYEALVHARTGQQWENTSFRPGPVFLHNPVASMGAMLLVPSGIMAALVARDRTGRGPARRGVAAAGRPVAHDAELELDRPRQLPARQDVAGRHPPGVDLRVRGREWIHAPMRSGVEPTRTEADVLGLEDVSMAELFSMSAG